MFVTLLRLRQTANFVQMFGWWGNMLGHRRRSSASSDRAMVSAAVDQVLAAVHVQDRSVSEVARAWAHSQGRSLVIEDVALPAGVFGRWLAAPQRDVVQIGLGVVGRDRTIAHELGHMVLGHHGEPVASYAADLMLAASPTLVAYMLQRTCADAHRANRSGAWPADECAAEQFAGLLMTRVEVGRWGRRSWAHHLDDALG